MVDFFHRMIALDANSLTLVIMICGWGFLIMRSMMPIAGVAVAAFPFLVASALASHALLRDTGYIAHLERGAGLAMSTGIGMTFALVVIVALVRIALAIHDATRKRPEALRNRYPA
jgi:hypothetical protein